ncbi:hypothetical protein [Nocardia sp. IFM 10818]
MEIILVITLVALLLTAAIVVGHAVDSTRDAVPKLTVADIQARLAAEPPRRYAPVARRW